MRTDKGCCCHEYRRRKERIRGVVVEHFIGKVWIRAVVMNMAQEKNG
jgi:hypothetical protein